MNAHDFLSEDGQVALLLGSAFGLSDSEKQGGATPFTLAEWNQLARAIHRSPLQRPAALPDRTAEELAADLHLAPEQAERIVRLLERGGRIALELETLLSRGMWVVARGDDAYPAKLRETLKHQAPTVLFGAGDRQLLERAGVAVVGSRTIDAAGTAFAQELGRKAAAAGWPVVSGGARGTDRLAMGAALDAGGTAVGVLADSLERTIRQPDLRQLLLDRRLVLLTPYVPTAGFSVGAAMGRNKVIYGLAAHAVVVSSDLDQGGTWAGAVEALKANWCPVFVRDGAAAPPGNRALLKRGALPLPEAGLSAIGDLPAWLREHTPAQPVALDLFAEGTTSGASRS